MSSTTKNLFVKRFLDLQKLFIKVLFIALFLRESSRFTKIGGGFRLNHLPRQKLTSGLLQAKSFEKVGTKISSSRNLWKNPGIVAR